MDDGLRRALDDRLARCAAADAVTDGNERHWRGEASAVAAALDSVTRRTRARAERADPDAQDAYLQATGDAQALRCLAQDAGEDG